MNGNAKTLSVLVGGVLWILCAEANAAIVFSRPPNGTGTLIVSSWVDPDGSDSDMYAYDSFIVGSSVAITEVQWSGGYVYGAPYGRVTDFTITFFDSIGGGSQPLVGNPQLEDTSPVYLVKHWVGSNAGEAPSGCLAMCDYSFVLPTPFLATAGTKYWLRIEASQPAYPDWGIAAGTYEDGHYFRFSTGLAMFQFIPGDTAFTLLGSDAPTYTIVATASPTAGGTISGAGNYPSGSNVSLIATANPGYGLLDWTEGGVQVSTSATYNFPATSDRTLVANFVAAYTITTSPSPSYGGSTTGDGIYNSGTSVTVVATPNPGFVFVDWTWFGTPMSSSPSYTFNATVDMPLVANFVTDPASVAFDFENASAGTSLPLDLTVGGLTAHFSATGSGFSIQPANTMGFTPAGFSGLCIYPNSVFAADLIVAFSQRLTHFSILYAPQELNCHDSATMRITALDGTVVGTNTTTAPNPGFWPTGTLSITVPGGFNSVVVHYDSRPPTCQDWGPIFLADNMIVTKAVSVLPPNSDPSGLNKARFISFSVPPAATAAVGETALRVWLVSLHHVSPPYTGSASVPFTLFEGQAMYVGPPAQYVESASSGTPFYASQLQCAPHYQDWSTVGLLHVTGEAIVPSSTYNVENLAASCLGNEASCTAVSAPLSISTTRWGDVEAPFNPPSPDPQPDTTDISALVDKFKSSLGAPIKARALLAGSNLRGTIEVAPDLNFNHISACTV